MFMGTPPQPILLVGISVRLLAQSAVRAGYRVLAVDYFGDTDLQALCPSLSLRHNAGQSYSPSALVELAATVEAPSVVYSASLENHPDEVMRLAEGRRLLGNPPEVLQRVRDPFQLAAALRARGFVFPETRMAAEGREHFAKGRWLWKPLRSGGGHSVRFWRGEPPPADGVVQAYVPGMVGSAPFVADGKRAVVLGLTEQLVGRRAFGASGFRYCGNLLPPRLPPEERQALLRQVREIVAHLTATFGLRGLNGLDFVWHKGRLWTLELNPRPTASAELAEEAYGLSVFDAHVRAFAGEVPAFDLEAAMTNASAAGKAILYAPHDAVWPGVPRKLAGRVRDIPHPREPIFRGRPVCTLVVTGRTPHACLRKLWAGAATLKAALATHTKIDGENYHDYAP